MSQFTILTVCTGNVCRSPLAEQLLRFDLGDISQVRVHSAGTGALVGAPMTPPTVAIASRLGVVHTHHQARQLTEKHLAEADLVLAMARDHRRAAAELVPRATRRTFTVREFARLAHEVPDGEFEASVPLLTDDVGDRLRAGVEAVASMRGTLPPLADPADDDVIDPYRQDDAVYERSASQLVPAVRAVAALLRRAAFGAL